MAAKTHILVVDAMNSLFQLHHAKVPVGDMLWRFISDMKQIALELKIHKIVMACDVGKSDYRLKLHPGYKGDRQARREKEAKENPAKAAADRAFLDEAYRVIDLLPMFGFEVVKIPNVEADDIIAYFANHMDLTKYRMAILSSDNDLLQLLRPGIVQRSYALKMGLKPTDVKVPPKVWVDVNRFKAAYEITPEQHTLFKAMAGDVGDSVYSWPGMGEGWALKVIRKYGSLDAVKEALPDLDIPRMPKKLGPLMQENWDEVIDLNMKLVNLRHTPEAEDEIFGPVNKALLDKLLAELSSSPSIDETRIKELMFEHGKVQLYDAYDIWVAPLQGTTGVPF